MRAPTSSTLTRASGFLLLGKGVAASAGQACPVSRQRGCQALPHPVEVDVCLSIIVQTYPEGPCFVHTRLFPHDRPLCLQVRVCAAQRLWAGL